jgi:putative pyruvate formate lyase activating enzyme
VYCQNYKFSQEGEGVELSIEELSRIFLALKQDGCHNLNWVTPSHFLPQLLSALALSASRGFDLPVVYNTSGYESFEALRILDGCVDVYLADMRYDSPDIALRYSGASDYPEINRIAIAEMWKQVGALEIDESGVAGKGLIIRHLILPRDLSGTRGICRFIAEEISPHAAVSLMSQYTPCHLALHDAMLKRRATEAEYSEAVGILAEYGLENGWIQEWGDEGVDRFLGAEMESNVAG